MINFLCILNAILNLGGLPILVLYENAQFLILLNGGAGLFYFGCYLASRYWHKKRLIVWLIMTLGQFVLFVNVLGNAGTNGGAHYYLIMTSGLAGYLLAEVFEKILAILLAVSFGLSIILIEYFHPEWIVKHASLEEKFLDVSLNYVGIMILIGITSLIFSKSLENEREKSKRLLLSILPESIAEELKSNDKVRPTHYDNVTVLFTDFVGFTRISEQMKPDQLVAELDFCFRQFDRISESFGLEKIKTIGDAYMAVAGLPEPNHSHAIDAILAALAMNRWMQLRKLEFEHQNSEYWNMRIGLHSGPVVAGVIGERKFAYDVWGDTVNTASRLESGAEPGTINISEAVYFTASSFFKCISRGEIRVKGKGPLHMYSVLGILPQYCDEQERPNSLFWKLYQDRFQRKDSSSQSVRLGT
ncbi:adenylate/guanylate cyclase domain-containing protein [Leptospira perolatii]|nr:adenylate/guanylate cyclase domain-containing protein [Leptospira perolatii]